MPGRQCSWRKLQRSCGPSAACPRGTLPPDAALHSSSGTFSVARWPAQSAVPCRAVWRAGQGAAAADEHRESTTRPRAGDVWNATQHWLVGKACGKASTCRVLGRQPRTRVRPARVNGAHCWAVGAREARCLRPLPCTALVFLNDPPPPQVDGHECMTQEMVVVEDGMSVSSVAL
jgi:hypothetical protein